MIYRRPAPEESIDQGDIIEGYPILALVQFDPAKPAFVETKHFLQRILILTQTCDFANQKAKKVVAALVFNAQQLVNDQSLKVAEIRGPIRAGRVWGWYYLPGNAEFGLPEMIVDLRQLHTVNLDLLALLCQRGYRKARVQPLYREHLAKHFADTYSRIGLPEPYETEP